MKIKILLFNTLISFLLIPGVIIISTFIENLTLANLFLSASLLSTIYFVILNIVEIRKEIFGEE